MSIWTNPTVDLRLGDQVIKLFVTKPEQLLFGESGTVSHAPSPYGRRLTSQQKTSRPRPQTVGANHPDRPDDLPRLQRHVWTTAAIIDCFDFCSKNDINAAADCFVQEKFMIICAVNDTVLKSFFVQGCCV